MASKIQATRRGAEDKISKDQILLTVMIDVYEQPRH